MFGKFQASGADVGAEDDAVVKPFVDSVAGFKHGTIAGECGVVAAVVHWWTLAARRMRI